eukprot:585846-Rhodomonas_salina.4
MVCSLPSLLAHPCSGGWGTASSLGCDLCQEVRILAGPPMQSMPMDRSVDYLDLRFRREDELSNLQNELRNSRMEEERIRAAMKTQEHIFARNQEEVAKFRFRVPLLFGTASPPKR